MILGLILPAASLSGNAPSSPAPSVKLVSFERTSPHR